MTTQVETESNSSTTNAQELLTVSEVAKVLRVDDTTVRRWIKHGVVEAIMLPHLNKRQSYRIKRGTLTKLLSTENESVVTHRHHEHS